MAFDKEKLHKTVEMRRKTMTGQEMLQEAALAYARWQGLTQEEGIDRGQAKADVDRLLDQLDEDSKAWEETKELVGVLNDRILGGLFQYSLQRSEDYLMELSKELSSEKQLTKARASDERDRGTKPAPSPAGSGKERKPDDNAGPQRRR